MNRKLLGKTGVRVSQLCFGTMSFGGDADKAESARLYKACREAGINFFDCADAYSDGLAEEILGDLAAHERDQLILTSKCFNPTSDDINDRGNNRRLKTDRLDLLFLHQWDPLTPIEESLRALEDLIREGKVLYSGASNFAAWQLATSLGISARKGWAAFDVIQPMYSLVKRQAEVEILPLAEAENLGVITYSPVGGGLLSGKYGPGGQRPESGRIQDNAMYNSRYSEAWVFETAGAFTALAADRGHHPVSLAVAWVAGHRAVTCPIIGARSVAQLQPSLAAVDIEMTADLRQEIAALSRQPALATDRFEESQS